MNPLHTAAESTAEAASISPTGMFVVGVGVTLVGVYLLYHNPGKGPYCSDCDIHATHDSDYCPVCGSGDLEQHQRPRGIDNLAEWATNLGQTTDGDGDE
ncbi:hypothetical protein B4589_009760 [Halolamina sp. CBA1230]|uniref:hypothetical protein n=1 Tax=Halolamina sp. CBA1230 TaxID=1853690 RepID=UPI00117A9CB6|nr:hypothetical protein [Halolamina sp. CBA1230]QKY20650.1 hypothetical protein B4589_009760 [Halolamina sp. CBA1230]